MTKPKTWSNQNLPNQCHQPNQTKQSNKSTKSSNQPSSRSTYHPKSTYNQTNKNNSPIITHTPVFLPFTHASGAGSSAVSRAASSTGLAVANRRNDRSRLLFVRKTLIWGELADDADARRRQWLEGKGDAIIYGGRNGEKGGGGGKGGGEVTGRRVKLGEGRRRGRERREGVKLEKTMNITQ